MGSHTTLSPWSEVYSDGAEMSSLVLVLLREDHLILGADRRHTRGDLRANYKNDLGLKTMTILSGYGVLGFAGHDLGEQILIPAKNDGKLDGTSLPHVAAALGDWAKVRYRECVPQFSEMDRPPSVEFLLAGFSESSNGPAATSYWLYAPDFVPHIAQFPYKKFETIGRSQHGALYALHRFGEPAQSIDSGLALSAFLLSEVCECDTTVGGIPELYVIHKGQKATRLTDSEVTRLTEWAKGTGAEIGKLILRGPASPR